MAKFTALTRKNGGSLVITIPAVLVKTKKYKPNKLYEFDGNEV